MRLIRQSTLADNATITNKGGKTTVMPTPIKQTINNILAININNCDTFMLLLYLISVLLVNDRINPTRLIDLISIMYCIESM